MTRKLNCCFVIVVVAGLLLPCVSAQAGDPNLIAHWAFDEGTGTIAYDSVGNNDGTLVNGPVWTPGQMDTALAFDGINDYVSVGSPTNLDNLPTNDFTLSAWIYDQYTSGTTWGTVIGCYAYNAGWHLRTFSDPNGNRALHLQVPHSGGNYSLWANFRSGFGTIAVNTWHHVVSVWDANSKTAKLYIDGNEPPYELTMPGVGPYNSDASNNKEIGRIPHVGGGHYFNGIIDDVRIYNTALTAEQVQQLHWEGSSGLGLAVARISDAIAEKQEALVIIDETLEKEEDAYAALEALLAGDDYGDLNKRDIAAAQREIESAIRRQQHLRKVLLESIESLQDSLSVLGYTPEPN